MRRIAFCCSGTGTSLRWASRGRPAQILAPGSLLAFGCPDALTDPVALELGEGRDARRREG